jgi:hypothetical protein
MRYDSAAMNVTGDRTAEHGLATLARWHVYVTG